MARRPREKMNGHPEDIRCMEADDALRTSGNSARSCKAIILTYELILTHFGDADFVSRTGTSTRYYSHVKCPGRV